MLIVDDTGAMAFRYIESDDYVAAVACATKKPRVLIVEPQRLFIRGLTTLLERDFTVVGENDGVAPDLIVIDADATPIGTVSDILADHSRAGICLLSLTAEPRTYARGARFHVLSKKTGEEEALEALTALARDPRPARVMTASKRSLPSLSNVSFSSSYLVAAPGARAGGDWYDVFQARDKIAFIIGDVAGHGIDAALTMNRVRQMMIRLALEHLAPEDILARTNALMVSEESLFATALCGYINESTREIVYSTAGHPPGILANRSGEASFLEYGGLMLGVDLRAAYQTARVTAPQDALLVLYTDGVTEHKRLLAESESRFFEAVRDAAVSGVQDAAREIENAVFQGEAPLDDAAILTIAFA